MTELMPSLCNDCVARNQCGNDDVKMCVSYIKEVKIKCDDCKFVEDCVDYGLEGCRKFTPAPSKPQTSEEWLRKANTEQLAEWLQEHMDCVSCGCKTLCCQGHDCKPALIKWLKQPHRNTK